MSFNYNVLPESPGHSETPTSKDQTPLIPLNSQPSQPPPPTRNPPIPFTKTLVPPTMGCTPSKPPPQSPQPPKGPSNPTLRPYKGPSEFRASAMAARLNRPQYQPYRPPTPSGTRPDRRVGQMYQVYKRQDQEREGRRYSWEGHPTERVFMTFEQMVERGVISRDKVVKK